MLILRDETLVSDRFEGEAVEKIKQSSRKKPPQAVGTKVLPLSIVPLALSATTNTEIGEQPPLGSFLDVCRRKLN